MDLSRFLVLYSGGADSTYLVESEPTARYLLHYESPNPAQTRIARINANILNRYLDIVPLGTSPIEMVRPIKSTRFSILKWH